MLFFNEINDLGKLSISTVAGGQVTLSWTAGLAVRLQSSIDLKTWKDVDNTAGADSASVTAANVKQFFRLAGP